MKFDIARIRFRNLLFRVFPSIARLLQRRATARGWLKHIQENGYSLPLPSILKRGMIRQLAIESNAKILVETGTFQGDTPWELADSFSKIHTIEIDPVLASLASQRLSSKTAVTVHLGDSSHVLSKIVATLDGTTLFWLDGHYSSGVTGQGDLVCPIYAELNSIFEGCRHPYVAMIDDARLFNTPGSGYPPMEDLMAFLSTKLPNARVIVFNDVIFVIPEAFDLKSSILPY